eukprot:1919558-Pyramimonas_sp.AAC.1
MPLSQATAVRTSELLKPKLIIYFFKPKHRFLLKTCPTTKSFRQDDQHFKWGWSALVETQTPSGGVHMLTI